MSKAANGFLSKAHSLLREIRTDYMGALLDLRALKGQEGHRTYPERMQDQVREDMLRQKIERIDAALSSSREEEGK